jgi:hypothetical protein
VTAPGGPSALAPGRLIDELPLNLSGPPIDFAAYHFDPHTLLAVILLSLAIAILAVTAVIPDSK